MKRTISAFLFVLMMMVVFVANINSQSFELITTNLTFESSNSLTFDVYVKNNSASALNYSHGTVAWTYNLAFLNGGTPTFSLVPGFSDFPAGAYPPSALITSPNILRTSSNMPGFNGTVQPGESLRLYRFRLQTSAGSFSSSYFNLSWKNAVTPYTRVYSWNPVSGLPEELTGIEYSIEQLILDENFDYGAVASNDLLTVTSNWTRHSGTAGPGYATTSLAYPQYVSSGIGGSVPFTFGSSGVNDGDVNRVLPTVINADNNIYAAFLLNLSAARATADYFFHLGPTTIGTTFRGRVFARSNGTGWSVGLSKSANLPDANDTTVLNYNQTYLIVLKYVFSTAATNDDVVSLYVYEAGIPASEPGSPIITIGPIGAGVTGDPTNIGSVAIRQGTNTPTGTIDGIRVGTTWASVFSIAGSPTLTAIPTALSGFSYLTGGGPSASQSYNLSGTDLTPASGNITVTGSTNYEVSLNNTSFGASVTVPYSSGTLSSTPIYVRLKAGLPTGVYNGEIITNTGGGATDVNVICNGAVALPEPTNHATNFTGVLGIPAYYLVNISWIDATGGTEPDGYLIRISDVDFASISDPADGTPVANSFFNRNVAQGVGNVSLGFFSSKTYYFKIFPYTNSGSLINYKIDGTVPQFSITLNNAPSLPVVENFDYAIASNLTDNGWVAHSAGGTNPIQVNDFALTYNGYGSSGLGKSVTLATSGEDINRAFDSIKTGSVYASFMVNVASAQTAGDYFFHLGFENTTSLFYGRVFVRKDENDNLAFGVAKIQNAQVVYTPFNYSLNTTYLIALKYTFVDGLANDEVSLWVNPILDGNEPAAHITQTDAGGDATSLGMFALRQGSATTAAVVTIGGIRVATTWIPASSASTFQLSVAVANGWNMVSIPGLHPVDQNVNTWWAGKDPAAGVFRFAGGYQAVTTVAPGTGYWMKHVGANTYNTGDEWPAGGIQIVPNDPIPAVTGWNLIGGYHNTVATAGLTTTPVGLISGQVFGYTPGSGYAAVTNLVPGYGYWIKLTGAGDINLPTSLAKSAPVSEYIKSDWGRIILTDAAGQSYILYSVDGEVDLTQYELPPLPPAGMFDVRYGSQRLAEVIGSEIQTIEMQGIEYPVTVRVEGMTIRLQDETGKIVNQVIKSGEDVVISNPQVGKLKVSGNVIPETYSLEQNYPNPFNPSTTIEFSIPEDVENLKLTIYDALGQKVAELVNGKLEAGRYSYQWDASRLSSGLYVYQLQTNKFTSTKKMMLMK